MVKYDVAYILNWLVVTGTMEFYDFAFSWEEDFPTDELIFFRGLKIQVSEIFFHYPEV